MWGGWAQDVAQPENIASYQNNHSGTEVYASNVPPGGNFLPALAGKQADPDPIIVAGPLLDTTRVEDQPGTGGNSSLISNSTIQNLTPTPTLGKTVLITAYDWTRYSFYAQHPIDEVSALTQIQYGLDFNSYLVLWTSLTGQPGGGDTTPRLRDPRATLRIGHTRQYWCSPGISTPFSASMHRETGR